MKKIIHQLSKAPAFILLMSILHLSAPSQNKHDSESKQPGSTGQAGAGVIHQEVDFTMSPQQLYNLLIDSKQFCKMTVLAGGFSANSAQIDSAVGGSFKLFDGHIIGRNIELVPNQRIVQVWRVVDWPAGVYSIAKFEFRPTASGTHLVFDHTGFPEKMKEGLAKGWQSHYWDLMTKYFGKK